jgi:ubiquinone/menaquinone biosynthesis C-methylase UbiE
MNEGERGQVSGSAAEVYEDFFVPALSQPWAKRVADAAQIRAGQRVLDVACGTGALTCEIVARVGPSGSVVGLDLNEVMLEVARRKVPTLEWWQGPVEALPFASASFDAVVSQFGLMFFENRGTAIEEMMRVLRPGGRLAVAVWGSLETSPGYAALAALVQRLCGDRVAEVFRAPFVLGTPQVLHSIFTEAGLPNAEITTQEGTARYPSIHSWVDAEVRGWTLGEVIADEQVERLLTEAEEVFRPFVTREGTVAFSMPALIVTATKA